MNDLTHWKLLINPDYFGAYALPNGDDLTVTIDHVQLETITVQGGKKEEHMIAHLVGVKPLILNRTNSKSINKLYGPYIEHWAGKQITLHASTTKMAGEIVECVRIRPTVEKPAPSPLSAARFPKALQAVKDGTFSADDLRMKFALTAEQDAELSQLTKVKQ